MPEIVKPKVVNARLLACRVECEPYIGEVLVVVIENPFVDSLLFLQRAHEEWADRHYSTFASFRSIAR
jgi:hypothetical protein